jgi:DNA polymerase-1
MIAALVAAGEDRLNSSIEEPLVRVLARMEVVGIPVDRDVLRAIASDLAEEVRSLEATIHDLAGEPFKINSVPQLRTVLYERLGLTPLRKTKTGFSTDARTLELLRGQHPIVEALLRYREVEKLRSTYGESLAAEVGADGRIHATFRQTVARTGRLSSDRPNLHNIPVRTEEGRRFRQAFVPSPGRRLLVADYDQVELRAIAHLSGDPGLTAAFAAGEDIHRTVAAQVFGVARDEVTTAQRSTAKMVSYGLAYGMEAYGLSQRLAVPVEEAQLILQAFFTAFPSVREYMERTVADARTAGYTVTAFGRRRPLPDLTSTNYQVRQAAERQAMNAGIQGLAADLFKVALIRLDSGLEEGGFTSDLVLQVHDEVLVDVDPDEEDGVAALTEQALTGAADLSVPLEVAMAWGSSWAEAKGA